MKKVLICFKLLVLFFTVSLHAKNSNEFDGVWVYVDSAFEVPVTEEVIVDEIKYNLPALFVFEIKNGEITYLNKKNSEGIFWGTYPASTITETVMSYQSNVELSSAAKSITPLGNPSMIDKEERFFPYMEIKWRHDKNSVRITFGYQTKIAKDMYSETIILRGDFYKLPKDKLEEILKSHN